MHLVEALRLRPSSVFSNDLPLGAKKASTSKLHWSLGYLRALFRVGWKMRDGCHTSM